MATLELTKENFEITIDTNNIVIIDFWAEWCGPCKRFGPVFEEASTRHPDVCFAKVDTENQQELAAYFGIRSIPTIVIFREKIGMLSQAGALSPDGIDELLSEIKAYDMDQVREEIANQKSDDSE